MTYLACADIIDRSRLPCEVGVWMGNQILSALHIFGSSTVAVSSACFMYMALYCILYVWSSEIIMWVIDFRDDCGVIGHIVFWIAMAVFAVIAFLSSVFAIIAAFVLATSIINLAKRQ